MTRLTFDFRGFTADAVGEKHGLTEADVASFEKRALRELRALRAERRKGEHPFLDLPYDERSRDEALAFAASVRERCREVVVLGIGGSALGNRALESALAGPHALLTRDRTRLFVLDNVDPELVGRVLDLVDPRETIFVAISKSGATVETVAQFLVVRSLLEQRLGAEHRDRLVVTTDPDGGALREIARRDGYRAFDVPKGVGGRFSVLSAVGLVTGALCGRDLRALLAGAAAMDERCREEDLRKNPALLHSTLHYLLLTKKKKSIFVAFAYAEALRELGAWWSQLVAESTGKRTTEGGNEVEAGATPLVAVGTTDQHSQLQLFVEGPNDKTYTFLRVAALRREVAIPRLYEDLPEAGYLGGRTLNELLEAERAGTEVSLIEVGRPCSTIAFPTLEESTVGEFLYAMEVSVFLLCRFLGVNPFDQPGVEGGKTAAFALMGRPGFEKRREEIAKRLVTDPKWIL